MRMTRMMAPVAMALGILAACGEDGPIGGPLDLFGDTAKAADGTTTPDAATCHDGIKNNSEADIDCGPGCNGKCANTKSCSANDHCASNYCSGNVCQNAPGSPAATSSSAATQPSRTFFVNTGWTLGYKCGGNDPDRFSGRVCVVATWVKQSANPPVTSITCPTGTYAQATCCKTSNLDDCQPSPTSGCWAQDPRNQQGCSYEPDCLGNAMIVCD